MTENSLIAIAPETEVRIQWVSSAAKARQLTSEGWCPVECSFGAESVVDSLAMDHHGPYSCLEPVALRSAKLHYGARRHDPRFVVTGAPDADASLAIVALCGWIGTSHDATTAQAPNSLVEIAQFIAECDLGKFDQALTESPLGRVYLTFNKMSGGRQDGPAFYAAIDRWLTLLTSNRYQTLADWVVQLERARMDAVRQAVVTRLSEHVAFVESEQWGFDVWYREIAPIIVAHHARSGRATIGCHSSARAEELLGPGGLLGVYPHLLPTGWGGRESVGGSPRDQKLERNFSLAAASVVTAMVNRHRSGKASQT